MNLKIKLHNGILRQEDALLLYKTYLSSMKTDYNNVVRRPVREAIFKAMCSTHNTKNDQVLPLISITKNNKGNIYFWSDQHFNHNNIIRFSDRPFHTTIEMNEYMYAQYLNIVKEEDMVIFGGDIAFGDVAETQQRLVQLPGRKVLVLGNHDFDKNKALFRDYHAFDATIMVFVYQEIFETHICNVLVTHYPVDLSYLPENTINVHGHIHCHLAGERRINMAVEHTKYQPMDLTEKIKEEFFTYCV